MDHIHRQVERIKINYIKANRCWHSSNLKSCLLICDQLTRKLAQLQPLLSEPSLSDHFYGEIGRLKNLVWYLKIRCLADDYYLNEPLLLNDDDIDDEDKQVRLINQTTGTANHQSSATTSSGATSRPQTAGRPVTAAGQRKLTTAGSRLETRQRTAILTGKRSSLSSRQSSQGVASSYRPLTTSLTATQTAFSRSTRPLLKYVACNLLAKDLFEYLYNVQTITNKCPDYRQCLEYLNLVRKSICKSSHLNEAAAAARANNQSSKGEKSEMLVDISSDVTLDEKTFALDSFWLNSFGICYYNLRMNKEAEEFFTCSRALSPKNLDAYTWLVKVYLRTNQPSQVLRICQLGLQHCKSSILYNWMARVQSLMNDLYKANLSLRESLRFHPTNIEALANVGHFAFYADKPELSLKCFERIQQLSINQSASLDSDYQAIASFSQLLNNLALSNFHCGYYNKVVPLFFRALLSSPNKEVTSDIWYNLSFVPISCGFINLSIACLKLALRNDSQNIEALNNLGVLKCRSIVNDELHFSNKQELWGSVRSQKSLPTKLSSLTSSDRAQDGLDELLIDDHERMERETVSLDEIRTFFRPPAASQQGNSTVGAQVVDCQPEMLYNMAVIEKKRGKFLASMRYCQLYAQHDQNNYHIQNMMREIRQLVSHNG